MILWRFNGDLMVIYGDLVVILMVVNSDQWSVDGDLLGFFHGDLMVINWDQWCLMMGMNEKDSIESSIGKLVMILWIGT